MSTAYYISYFDTQKRTTVSEKVSEGVQRYVIQLECYVKDPSISRLTEVHPKFKK